MTLNDAILEATGGPTVNDGLRAFFTTGGATGTTLNDLEQSYLTVKLVAAGPINQRWMTYLGAVPFSFTGALMDRLLSFWSTSPAP